MIKFQHVISWIIHTKEAECLTYRTDCWGINWIKHLTHLAWLYLCGHGTGLWVAASGIFLNATTRAEIAHKDIWGYVIVVSSHRVSCHIKPPAQRRNRQHRRYVSPRRVLSLPTIFFFFFFFALSRQYVVFPKKKESDGENSPGLSFWTVNSADRTNLSLEWALNWWGLDTLLVLQCEAIFHSFISSLFHSSWFYPSPENSFFFFFFFFRTGTLDETAKPVAAIHSPTRMMCLLAVHRRSRSFWFRGVTVPFPISRIISIHKSLFSTFAPRICESMKTENTDYGWTQWEQNKRSFTKDTNVTISGTINHVTTMWGRKDTFILLYMKLNLWAIDDSLFGSMTSNIS